MRLWFCFYLQLLQAVRSQLLPPNNIHLEDSRLTWSPSTQDRNVTYTVQYLYSLQRAEEDRWMVVPACHNISSCMCDVRSTKAVAGHGCVLLRVGAESGGHSSPLVEACSQHGDRCTPEVRLSSRPGSLTVHLSRDHSLAQDYAANANHRIYWGKEGEPLQECSDAVSSLNILELEEGQRYCVQVRYVIYGKNVGVPSCVQCLEVPQAGSGRTGMIVVVMLLIFVLVVVAPVVAYLLIFHRKKIKGMLQPPLHIPESFGESLHQQQPLTYQPEEEEFHQLSIHTPKEREEGGVGRSPCRSEERS